MPGPLALLGLGAAASGLGGALGGIFGGGKPVVPQLPKIDIGQQQSRAIQDAIKELPNVGQLGRGIQDLSLGQLQRALDFALPGGLGQAQNLVRSQLAGEVPTDVAQQIQRSAAAAGFAGGFQGSGLGRNLTARDLGLTSLGIRQQGLSNLGQLASLSVPTVTNPASMFLSPAQRLQGAFQERDAQFNRDMIAAGVAAQPSPLQSALGSGISGAFGALGQGLGFAGGMGFANQFNQPKLPSNFFTPF